MNAAWFCPSCQRHHAPHVETCPAPAPQGGEVHDVFKPRPFHPKPHVSVLDDADWFSRPKHEPKVTWHFGDPPMSPRVRGIGTALS